MAPPTTPALKRPAPAHACTCNTSPASTNTIKSEDSPMAVNPAHSSAGFAGTRSARPAKNARSEEHTSELQSRPHLVCRLLLETKHDVRLTHTLPRSSY